MRVTRTLLRLLVFDLKGVVSLALWAGRRRHGVPPGARPVTYSRGQTLMLTVALVLATAELGAVELLLQGLGAPAAVRVALLVLDAYAALLVLTLIAAGVTRPHVVTDQEVRVRYGVFFDVTVPRHLIVGARRAQRQERRPITVDADQLAVSVLGQTNLVLELGEPVTAVRPLGRPAVIRTLRLYADDPTGAVRLLTGDGPTTVPYWRRGSGSPDPARPSASTGGTGTDRSAGPSARA